MCKGQCPSVILALALCALTGLPAAFGGTDLSKQKDSTERGSTGPVRARLYPTERNYPLLTIEDTAKGFPTEAAWERAFRARTFLHKGRPEPQDRRTSLRMLRGAGVLHVSVECPTPEERDNGESVTVYLTQSDRPDFPYVVVELDANGALSVGVVARPYTQWAWPPIAPVPEDAVRHQATADETGRRVVLSISLSKLGVPRDGFYFNVVRRHADGSTYAWCDLFGGSPGQVEVFAQAIIVADPKSWENGLEMPAEVAVGLNRLHLERPDPALSVRVGDGLLRLDETGEFDLVVTDRGPLDLELVTEQAQTIATYHADVPRPLLAHAREAFLPAGANEFALEITLNLAGEDDVPLTITCRRTGGSPEEHEVTLSPGRHTLDLPVPAGDGHEVTVEVEATVPVVSADQVQCVPVAQEEKVLRLRARHWFCVGVAREDFDNYREGVRELPTDRMYWAVTADAVGYVRRRQAGSGAFGRVGRNQGSIWQQAFVYPVALLYKAEHPDNPFTGDRALLESAVLGMEFALRPTVSVEEHLHPDNRSLQAYLLTYELLKDDIEPERRDYWAYELKHRVEGVVRRWLRPLEHRYALYSADCGTGTNHLAYHVANVYLAGEVFDNPEWKELGRKFMHGLARHGPEGHFEERQGLPVNHYTWLSANALGEYYWRTGDPEVEPTLQACARYMTAITTAQGETMSLHDGRVSSHRPFWFGDFVLSLTPEGRSAARARLLGIMRERPSKMSLELLWRCAENAACYQAGPEADVFSTDDELSFSHGVIVRKQGFHYGLSTICLGPIRGNFRLDPQNVVELFHKDAGCILNAGNSQSQPEAGTFLRRLDGPDRAKEPTAPRVDYLPITASIATLPDGHDVTLTYWSFSARLAVHIVSPSQARIVATVDHAPGAEPVVFNFFPGVKRDEDLRADGQTLRFGKVTLQASKLFHVEHSFRIMNPYQMEFTYTHKPVRCWLELDAGETFILDIRVGSDGHPTD